MADKKEIFIVKFDGCVGMVIPGRCPTRSYTEEKNFVSFVQSIIEDYPNHKLRCVMDKEHVNDLRLYKKTLENMYKNKQKSL